MTSKEIEIMTDSELDDMVHDLKSEEASEINNRGRERQIAYILGEFQVERDMPDDTFCTPGEWHVEPTDEYGTYRLREAAIEQRDWADEGYGKMEADAEIEEGDRRGEISTLHDAGNARLMQEAPEMFRLLSHVAGRLNLEGRENPCGEFMLAACRQEINELLARIRPLEIS